MPTLDWIGKDKIITHHLDVPYHVLDRKYSFDENGQTAEDNGSENMIIHGDNLIVLKSLLPKYEGKIKCIYIDPPYNTGNESWIYNDNVNDPKIKKWLGDVVGKPGEDFSRHDKWLCMMYPRLKLLQQLLSNDGAIFISIDDNEEANLKLICNEIFGENCFIGDISWQKTYSPKNNKNGIATEVEHILSYGRNPNWTPNMLPRTAEMDSKYKTPDKDAIPWKTTDSSATGAFTHQGMVYAIQNPFTGKLCYPPDGRCWCREQPQLLQIMNQWAQYELRDLNDAERRAKICGTSPEKVRPGVKAIMLAEPLEDASKHAQQVYEEGAWPVFYFTAKGRGGIAKKTYLGNVQNRVPTNLWLNDEVGHTDEAKKEIKTLFNGLSAFDTPKPTRLIERILQIATNQEDIILDSFAGSGTTGHAVLNMNKKDGGQRNFILIEMMDYADSITAEREKRVICGYGQGNKAVDGIGGSFSYYELGDQLLVDGKINEKVPEDKIREYIWYMETRKEYKKPDSLNSYYLGRNNSTDYYFYYMKDSPTVLNRTFLATIKEKAESYVIYADKCLISEKDLTRYGITFKKIPRDVPVL